MPAYPIYFFLNIYDAACIKIKIDEDESGCEREVTEIKNFLGSIVFEEEYIIEAQKVDKSSEKENIVREIKDITIDNFNMMVDIMKEIYTSQLAPIYGFKYDPYKEPDST